MNHELTLETELVAAANLISNCIKSQNQRQKILVLLRGEIGSGKTRLVQLICAEFLIYDCTSPTYLFYREYHNSALHLNFLHVDFYRSRATQQTWTTLLIEAVEKANVIFIEWAEKSTNFFSELFDFLQINVNFLPTRTASPILKINALTTCDNNEFILRLC